MKTSKKLLRLTVAALFLSTSFMMAHNIDPIGNTNGGETLVATEKKDATIVGVAASNEDFSTLVAAVKAADLVETLNSDGPFTVFAPTNAAFAKLPEGTVDNLLKPENKGVLTSILTYHVVKGKFMAADVLKAIKDNQNKFKIETVNGEILEASFQDGKVMLKDKQGNTSMIVLTDVAASNGVIHAIDSVVMP